MYATLLSLVCMALSQDKSAVGNTDNCINTKHCSCHANITLPLAQYIQSHGADGRCKIGKVTKLPEDFA